jgi:hypothetical protein
MTLGITRARSINQQHFVLYYRKGKPIQSTHTVQNEYGYLFNYVDYDETNSTTGLTPHVRKKRIGSYPNTNYHGSLCE